MSHLSTSHFCPEKCDHNSFKSSRNRNLNDQALGFLNLTMLKNIFGSTTMWWQFHSYRVLALLFLIHTLINLSNLRKNKPTLLVTTLVSPFGLLHCHLLVLLFISKCVLSTSPSAYPTRAFRRLKVHSPLSFPSDPRQPTWQRLWEQGVVTGR